MGWGRGILPAAADKAVLACNELARHDCLSSRRKTPTSRAKCLVQYAPVFDLGEVEDAVGLDLDVIGVQLGLQDGALLGGERRAGKAMV